LPVHAASPHRPRTGRGSVRSAAEHLCEDVPMRRKRKEATWEDTGTAELRQRLEVATARAQEAEERAARAEGRSVDTSNPMEELLLALESRSFPDRTK